jgi:hypothetical protein
MARVSQSNKNPLVNTPGLHQNRKPIEFEFAHKILTEQLQPLILRLGAPLCPQGFSLRPPPMWPMPSIAAPFAEA